MATRPEHTERFNALPSQTTMTAHPGSLPASATLGSISVRHVFAVVALPLALLTTNVTLGLTSTETVPVIFVLVGCCYVVVRGTIREAPMMLVAALLVAYGLGGAISGSAIDGLKIVGAGFVFFAAMQLAPWAETSRACRIAIAILFALRVASLAVPSAFVQLYQMLGLRGADYYGGTAAILFAEPSYLATAVLCLWGIGRMGLPAGQQIKLTMLDYAAIIVLGLSFSVWGILAIAVGLPLILRRSLVKLVVTAGLAVAVGVVANAMDLTPGRVQLFLTAIVNVVQSGYLFEFATLDPSATHRIVQTYLALTSALSAPLGRFGLELTPVLLQNADWSLPIFGSSPVVLQLIGNLYANTVPLQLLVFGGIPLFSAFMIPAALASIRLWRARNDNQSSLIVLAAIVFGCFGQSITTSPFLYLAIASGLAWTTARSASTANGNLSSNH